MPSRTTIKCPNCQTEIDVNEVLSSELEKSLTAKHAQELEDNRQKYKKAMDDLKVKESSIEEAKEKFDDELKQATKKQIKVEREKLSAEIKKAVEEEQSESLALLKKEVEDKSKQVKELNETKAQVEQLKREKDEATSVAKLDAQKKLTEELKCEKAKLAQQAYNEKEQILKEIKEASELEIKAKDEQISQMTKSIEDAKRKAEQGSMQVQGEALETLIEARLACEFPFDTIDEIKKGAFGADCVQTIHTRDAQNCGVICYESKNTKAWSDGWVAKLKQDMLKVNADIGVLVTAVYPSDMKRMGFVDGIWVCSIDEFKGSASLLRESLIRVHSTLQKEDNKADKMTLLYNYLTGNEFNMQLKAIVDGFMAMQTELDKERRSLMASWKRRQKLIDGVLQNTTEMYGSLQGIAGSVALGKIDALELADETEGSDDSG
ncbi:MAG: DUF2130 domain-containing protein [Cocleimonas sp.]